MLLALWASSGGKLTSIHLQTANDLAAATGDPVQIVICQNSKCCQVQLGDRSKTRGTFHEFLNQDLGECENSEWSMQPFTLVRLDHVSGSDGYRASWIKLFRSLQGQTNCPVHDWIDDAGHLDLSCTQN